MKMHKRFVGMLLAVVMALSMSVSALAAEPNKASIDAQEAPVASSELVILRDENGEVHFEVPNDNSIDPRIPGLANIVAVSVYNLDQNRVRVSIQNVGLDWVDSVSMNIKIYNARGLQYDRGLTETSIKQMLPRNNDYYVTGWNRIVITNIVAKDEGDVGYLNDIDYSK